MRLRLPGCVRCCRPVAQLALGKRAEKITNGACKRLVDKVNAEYDVEGFCKELPDRLEELKKREGDRLKK